MGSFTAYQVKRLDFLITITNPIFLTGSYYNASADSSVLLQIRSFTTSSADLKNGSNSTITEGYVLIRSL